MKVSENFSRSEFACKCGCGFQTVDIELIIVHEFVRKKAAELVGEEVYTEITSGCRCRKHNKRQGGVRKSKHTEANASDFKVRLKRNNSIIDPRVIYNIIDNFFPNKFGLGLYHNRVHLDTQPTKKRWEG